MANKIAIIGCGNVGLSYAYSLVNNKNSINELVLIDINKEKTIGEVMDLNHAIPFAPNKINIKYGDYKELNDTKIIVISAGANQNIGETRNDLVNKNKKIFKSIIENINKTKFNGIIIIATNPVDVMTYYTQKYSNLPYNQVIGTGTILDTARLRYQLSEILNINSKNIHAYVIGEHGDTSFIPWNNIIIGTVNIKEYKIKKDNLENEIRNMAYEIINRKGNTSYGIGMSLTRITNAILNDENTILTISSYDKKNKIYYGYPTIINKDGAIKRTPINLTKEEQNKLKESINSIKKTIKESKTT